MPVVYDPLEKFVFIRILTLATKVKFSANLGICLSYPGIPAVTFYLVYEVSNAG